MLKDYIYNKNMAFGYIKSSIDVKIAKNNFFEIESREN